MKSFSVYSALLKLTRIYRFPAKCHPSLNCPNISYPKHTSRNCPVVGFCLAQSCTFAYPQKNRANYE